MKSEGKCGSELEWKYEVWSMRWYEDEAKMKHCNSNCLFVCWSEICFPILFVKYDFFLISLLLCLLIFSFPYLLDLLELFLFFILIFSCITSSSPIINKTLNIRTQIIRGCKDWVLHLWGIVFVCLLYRWNEYTYVGNLFRCVCVCV